MFKVFIAVYLLNIVPAFYVTSANLVKGQCFLCFNLTGYNSYKYINIKMLKICLLSMFSAWLTSLFCSL